MAFDKVSFLVLVLFVGISVAASDFDDQLEPDWPAGISPLDTLSYWSEPESVEEAAPTAPCCLPRTFTATLFTEIRREGGKDENKPKPKPKPKSIRFMEVVYIDQTNRRIAQDITVPRGRNATRISYILLFKGTGNSSSATLYAFSRTSPRCVTKVLKGAQFRPMCLPANSTLFGSFSFGAGARALPVQSWGFIYRDRRLAMGESVILTSGNCVPVLVEQKIVTRKSTAFNDDPDKGGKVITIGSLYTNASTTISGSHFDPPSYCNKTDDTLLFDPYIDFTTIINRYVAVP